jgi:carboxymethylenebutenolidase
MFLGTNDEEVSPLICQRIAERAIAAGTKLDLTVYPGATHDFDDPGDKRQSVPGNQAAKAEAMAKAATFVAGVGK